MSLNKSIIEDAVPVVPFHRYLLITTETMEQFRHDFD